MYCKEQKKQRPLPGLYETAEEAACVLAKAKRDGITRGMFHPMRVRLVGQRSAHSARASRSGTTSRRSQRSRSALALGVATTRTVQGGRQDQQPRPQAALGQEGRRADDCAHSVQTRRRVHNQTMREWLAEYDGSGE